MKASKHPKVRAEEVLVHPSFHELLNLEYVVPLRRGRIVLLIDLTYGLTLNFIFTPMAASSTSRYFRTPGIATTVTSSPPTNFSPFPSSQTSALLSHPTALVAHRRHL